MLPVLLTTHSNPEGDERKFWAEVKGKYCHLKTPESINQKVRRNVIFRKTFSNLGWLRAFTDFRTPGWSEGMLTLTCGLTDGAECVSTLSSRDKLHNRG